MGLYAGIDLHGGAVAPGARCDTVRLDLVMRRYATGDDRAFAEVYRELAPALLRFCRRLSRRRDEARDVFQDALLRLHRARATYVPGSPALGWAFAIARSSFLDRLRRRRARPEATLDLDAACALGMLTGRAGSPEGDLFARELAGVVERELGRMPEGSRQAFLLRAREDLSVQATAAALGTSRGAAKQRSHRAHTQIRDAVREAGW